MFQLSKYIDTPKFFALSANEIAKLMIKNKVKGSIIIVTNIRCFRSRQQSFKVLTSTDSIFNNKRRSLNFKSLAAHYGKDKIRLFYR